MNDQLFSINTIQPVDDELAAALAAVQAYLDSQAVPVQPVEAVVETTGWQRSARLSVQGLRPARTASPPRWNTVERLRRASGFFGVVGL